MSVLVLNQSDLIDSGKAPTRSNIQYNMDAFDTVVYVVGSETTVLKSSKIESK